MYLGRIGISKDTVEAAKRCFHLPHIPTAALPAKLTWQEHSRTPAETEQNQGNVSVFYRNTIAR
jgi:hypothetical protein